MKDGDDSRVLLNSPRRGVYPDAPVGVPQRGWLRAGRHQSPTSTSTTW